jgi:hypothetical protein
VDEIVLAASNSSPKTTAEDGGLDPTEEDTTNFRTLLVPDDVADLPLPWIKSLHQAALTIDNQAILELLDEVELTHAPLKTKMTKLIDHFHFDVILEFLQACYPDAF